MPADKKQAVKVVSVAKLAPCLRVVHVTMTTGKNTLTAAQCDLVTIEGYAGGCYGATTAVGEFVTSTTDISSAVTSIDLEILSATVADDSVAAVASGTASLLVWGTVN